MRPKRFKPGQVWEKSSGRLVLVASMDGQTVLIHSLTDLQMPPANKIPGKSMEYIGKWKPQQVTIEVE